MTYRPATRHRESKPAASQEDRLLDLLRQGEGFAYALAHGYDVGGQPDRAYALVALGERLHNAAADVRNLTRPLEPHSVGPTLGLRARAFSLRKLLRGTAWQGPGVAPLVPRLADKQPLVGRGREMTGAREPTDHPGRSREKRIHSHG